MRFSKIPFLILTYAALASSAPASAALHPGRYIGYLTQNGSTHKTALTFDLFAVKTDDPDAFPVQRAILKIGLGGLQSSEYVTEFYDTMHFDPTNGILSMGGAANDISMTMKVSGNEQSFLDGQVFIRTAATTGTIHLVEYADDPDATSGTLPGAQYTSQLSGQYSGNCDGRQAILQVETARGLEPSSADKHGLAPYSIIGRLGMYDNTICPGFAACSMRAYTSGTFDIFRGRLILDASTGPDDCQIKDDVAKCNVHLGTIASQCTLKRGVTIVPNPTFYSRNEFIATTPAQMAKLPDPRPPAHKDLIAALQGDFTGYLHNETKNQYQIMRMNVAAFPSNDNPDNRNLIFVSASTILYFGNTISDDFFVQQFDPHSFYLVPGFTLGSAASDGFLQIAEWRLGYIRGVWYSRAFGKVGTVELVKGLGLPPISNKAKFVPSISGDYIGPHGSPGDGDFARWFNLIIPTQNPTQDASTLDVKGQFQLRNGGTPRRAIEQGAFDFYSGAIAWKASHGQIVTGNVVDGPNLQLFWPGVAGFGILLPRDHNLYPYARQ